MNSESRRLTTKKKAATRFWSVARASLMMDTTAGGARFRRTLRGHHLGESCARPTLAPESIRAPQLDWPPNAGALRAPVPPWKLSPAEASAAACITAEALGPRPPIVTTIPPPHHGHRERHHHHHGWPPRAGQQKCEPLAISPARPQGAMRTESAPDATPSSRLSTHHHQFPRPTRQWYVYLPLFHALG